MILFGLSLFYISGFSESRRLIFEKYIIIKIVPIRTYFSFLSIDGAPNNVKPELIYYVVDWWFLHPNYEFKPKELERSKYPRIEDFIY